MPKGSWKKEISCGIIGYGAVFNFGKFHGLKIKAMAMAVRGNVTMMLGGAANALPSSSRIVRWVPNPLILAR